MAAKLKGTNVMPGGRVEEIPIEPKYVSYAGGSALVQGPTAIANASKMTLSMGVQCAIVDLATVVTNNFDDKIFMVTAGTGDDRETFLQLLLRYRTLVGSQPAAPLVLMTFHNVATPAQHVFTHLSNDEAFPNDGLPHHLFISFDASTSPAAVSIYIDGVDVLNTSTAIDTGLPTTLPINGKDIGFPVTSEEIAHPSGFTTSLRTHAFANTQVWFGQAIDPAATSTGAKTWAPSQANNNVLKELVDGANFYRVDVLKMLTIAIVESNLNPNNVTGSYVGIFQFKQGEIDAALLQLSGTGQGNLKYISDQLYAYTWWVGTGGPAGPSAPEGAWGRLVQSVGLSDPTGKYSYLVHNQGPYGMPAIINAFNSTPNASILAAYRAALPSVRNARDALFRQAWSSSLNKDTTTVAQWLTAFDNHWTAKTAEAAAKLVDATGVPNIEFFYKDGLLRLPNVAQDQFGTSDILLWGAKADFITGTVAHNDGSGGDFTVVAPSGVTDV